MDTYYILYDLNKNGYLEEYDNCLYIRSEFKRISVTEHYKSKEEAINKLKYLKEFFYYEIDLDYIEIKEVYL